MNVVFRAGDVPPATRLDYWKHVIGDVFVPLDVQVSGGFEPRDQMRVGAAGPVCVAQLSMARSHLVERARTHIRRLDPELCKIDVQARGRAMIEQDGRQSVQTPGDITFVDLSRPSRWAYSSVHVVALVFPRALVPLPQDDLARLTGVRIPGDRGIGTLVSSLARKLPAHLDDAGPADQARLGTAVLDLVTTALATRLDRTHQIPTDSRRRALLLRVLAFIDARLGDADLSPTSIAEAHYISVRSLYTLFETQQATPADWIRQRRLERCRRDLLDPAHADTPVSRIAARWGFASPAHFSRTFRDAYGLTPVEYRSNGHHTATP